MVEGAALEVLCARKGTEGSNPSLSVVKCLFCKDLTKADGEKAKERVFSVILVGNVANIVRYRKIEWPPTYSSPFDSTASRSAHACITIPNATETLSDPLAP